eukprot:7388220-Prymnesium_polylepis.2
MLSLKGNDQLNAHMPATSADSTQGVAGAFDERPIGCRSHERPTDPFPTSVQLWVNNFGCTGQQVAHLQWDAMRPKSCGCSG